MPLPGNDTRIVSIDVATGATTDVPAGPGVKFNPSILSDTEIGYIRKDSDAAGIYYTNGTRGPKGQVRAASWSPDGSRVVFHRRQAAPTDWWRSTWSRNPEYDLSLTSIMPSFSRDGGRFVVDRPAAGRSDFRIERRDRHSTDRTTSKSSIRTWRATCSRRSGRRTATNIIFGIGVFNAFFNGFHGLFLKPEDRAEGGAQIAMINPDGTGFRELTTGPNNNGFPSMAPDGKRFVYRTFGPEGDGLRIMNIETQDRDDARRTATTTSRSGRRAATSSCSRGRPKATTRSTRSSRTALA